MSPVEDQDTTSSPPQTAVRKHRVAIRFPIEVSGLALDGRDFVDQAVTSTVSSTGAAILVERALAPEQILTIKRPGASPEAEVRVVGHMGKEGDANLYGVAFVQAPANFWGIDSAGQEIEQALATVVLECFICNTRQVVRLNELEMGVLESTRKLSRPCPTCRDSSVWKYAESATAAETTAAHLSSPAPAASAVAAHPPAANRRKHARVKMEKKGCILFGGQQSMIQVVDLSRGGVRFRSRRSFAQGLLVRVAIPYIEGAGNIFVPARICWCKSLADGTSECGLKYVKD